MQQPVIRKIRALGFAFSAQVPCGLTTRLTMSARATTANTIRVPAGSTQGFKPTHTLAVWRQREMPPPALERLDLRHPPRACRRTFKHPEAQSHSSMHSPALTWKEGWETTTEAQTGWGQDRTGQDTRGTAAVTQHTRADRHPPHGHA